VPVICNIWKAPRISLYHCANTGLWSNDDECDDKSDDDDNDNRDNRNDD